VDALISGIENIVLDIHMMSTTSMMRLLVSHAFNLSGYKMAKQRSTDIATVVKIATLLTEFSSHDIILHIK